MPIPTEQFTCRKGCCKRTYCPLTLAYARTIHTFQGLQAGPTNCDNENAFEHLIIDPDQKEHEGRNIGLLYTATSRGTTLGDDSGLNSAVYFTGTSMKPTRIKNITIGADGKEFELATKRRHWVNYLQGKARSSESRIQQILTKKSELFEWAKTTTIPYDVLFNRLESYRHRQSNQP